MEVFEPPLWSLDTSSSASGFEFRLADRDGDVVLAAMFERRIELAASQSSPSGRYLVFVQANNLASEVTVLDAARQSTWNVDLPHDADLAAYAITIVVDAAEQCVAIGQVRADGRPAETWFIDLESRQVSGPVSRFVVAWLR